MGKGQQGTVWVLHRGERVWDAGTFESNGAGEKSLLTTPIAADVMLQLDQDTGAALPSPCSATRLHMRLPTIESLQQEGGCSRLVCRPCNYC